MEFQIGESVLLRVHGWQDRWQIILYREFSHHHLGQAMSRHSLSGELTIQEAEGVLLI